MTKALGKEGSFAEGRPIALGKDSLKKFWNISLPRAMVGDPRQRLKKRIICLPRAVPLPSAKIFCKNSATFLCRGPWLEALDKDFSKKRIILCREPPEMALGKDSVPGAGAVMAAFLCRVPVQPSAKTLFADSKFPESSLSRAALGKAFAEG